MKRKKKTIIMIGVVVLVLALAFLLILKDQKKRKVYQVTPVKSQDSYTVTYNGEKYQYNSKVETILLIGVDSTGPMEVSADYGEQARADNLDLIIIDHENKCIKVLPVSRDTYTEVTNYTAKGYAIGKVPTHLGFAFSFGDGGNASSKNVCSAVSELLYGVEIYRYVTTNIDSIGYANDLIGGVDVVVPNNDLAFMYPEMVKGATVTMTKDNVAEFLRYRNLDQDASNVGRMQRQRAFLQSYIEKLETMTESDYVSMWEKLQKDSNIIKTNINQDTFQRLLNCVKDYSYDPDTCNLNIAGKNDKLDGYDVFYVDEDQLKELVINVFYKKVGGN